MSKVTPWPSYRKMRHNPLPSVVYSFCLLTSQTRNAEPKLQLGLQKALCCRIDFRYNAESRKRIVFSTRLERKRKTEKL